MRLILEGWFWFMHVPFTSMVKFQFLALFVVGHFLHQVVPSPLLILHKFAAFDYLLFWVFFHTNGFPLVFEWQQDFFNLQ